MEWHVNVAHYARKTMEEVGIEAVGGVREIR